MRLPAARLWLTAGWTLSVLVVWLSLTPVPPEPGIDLGDKVSHGLAYAVLMYCFARAEVERMSAAIWLMILGLTLEVLQGISGYRYAEALDMLADAAGIAVGWVVAELWPRVSARFVRR